jgi:hypothetical protein
VVAGRQWPSTATTAGSTPSLGLLARALGIAAVIEGHELDEGLPGRRARLYSRTARRTAQITS